MRLVRAELRKAMRPLVAAVAVGLVAAAAIFAWQQQVTANQLVDYIDSPAATAQGIAQSAGAPQIPTCDQLGLSPGPQCDLVIKRARDAYNAMVHDLLSRADVDRATVRTAAMQQNPLGAGQMAAWLMASVLGAVAIFIIAAGHVGGEWSGGTMATVVVQDGRRWRLVAAKLVSMLVIAEALLLATWAALALLAFPFQAAYPLPAAHQVSWSDAASAAVPVLARSVLVTASFTVIGVLAAVITRNVLGTLLLATGGLLAWMAFVLVPPLSVASIGYWVTGWMGFTNDGFSWGQLWSGVPPGVAEPTTALGLTGLVALVVAGVLVSTLRFRRLDIA